MFTIVLVLTLINPIAAFASTTAYSDNEIGALISFYRMEIMKKYLIGI